MIRLVIGSILGGIAQWFVGFVFWGTPLSRLAFKVAGDDANAAVQTALAQNLTALGTGTYYVPWPDTPAGTVLHGRGPVALIHFNTGGFSTMDTGALVGGLILSIISVFLIGLILWLIADRVSDFATRAKIVVLATVATTLYFVFGLPVFNYYLPWPYFIYLGVSDLVGLLVGGLVVARWFLPKAPIATLH
jgi:hypothetical protein